MPLPVNLLRFIRDHRDEPALSVYVEGVPADPGARRAWRVRLRRGLQDARESVASARPEERDAFEQCEADLLRRLPEGEATPSPTGWAFFRAATGEALALTIATGAVETSVRWGRGPSVVPFLRIASPERALVVRLDLEHAELSRWREGTLDPLERFEADRPHEVGSKMGGIPRRGFHGGTRGRSQSDEEQHQRTDGQERLRDQARHALLAQDDGETAIVLGGAARATRQFLAVLPPATAERTIIAPGLTMRTTLARIPTAIRTALGALGRTKSARRVATLLEDAHAQGHAGLGLEMAHVAADAGAIDSLLFSEAAWRRDPDAIEALVLRALGAGASVQCVASAEQSGLDGAAQGIITALRFPLSAAPAASIEQEI